MVRTSSSQSSPPREGGVFVLLLISLCVIVALLAVTFDGGRLLGERRRVQQTADLAALAAAADLYNRYGTNQGLDPGGNALTAAQESPRRTASPATASRPRSSSTCPPSPESAPGWPGTSK
jgi:uncharacterized membrane protein